MLTSYRTVEVQRAVSVAAAAVTLFAASSLRGAPARILALGLSGAGLAACAESIAVWKAVSEGERDIVAVAVAAGLGREAAPCGRCRQVLLELAPRAWVCWRDARGRVIRRSVRSLLPRPFGLG